MILLDPTGEQQPPRRQLAERPKSIEGLTIGLLDISKPRGDLFLDALEERLRARGAEIGRYRKPTFARRAPIDLRQEIGIACNLVIEALAD